MELDILLRNPQEIHSETPVEFINKNAWNSIKALSLLPSFSARVSPDRLFPFGGFKNNGNIVRRPSISTIF